MKDALLNINSNINHGAKTAIWLLKKDSLILSLICILYAYIHNTAITSSCYDKGYNNIQSERKNATASISVSFKVFASPLLDNHFFCQLTNIWHWFSPCCFTNPLLLKLKHLNLFLYCISNSSVFHLWVHSVNYQCLRSI